MNYIMKNKFNNIIMNKDQILWKQLKYMIFRPAI